jgi:hypothetical protein
MTIRLKPLPNHGETISPAWFGVVGALVRVLLLCDWFPNLSEYMSQTPTHKYFGTKCQDSGSNQLRF